MKVGAANTRRAMNRSESESSLSSESELSDDEVSFHRAALCCARRGRRGEHGLEGLGRGLCGACSSGR
eukprot:COSAG02_NODE_840_length_16627_cov_11.279828_13_plen_68_part_00